MMKKARKRLYLRIVMLTIIFSLLVWAWILFAQNYRNITLSQRMVDAIIQDNVALARKYAGELGLAQENLDQTRAFVVDLKDENKKLKEQVQLMGELKGLEAQIETLRAENDQLAVKMGQLKGGSSSISDKGSWQFDTVEEGKNILKELRGIVRDVKARIWNLREKKQKEMDDFESMVGNQGYLVKDGQLLAPVTIIEGQATVKQDGQVKVDVKFVK